MSFFYCNYVFSNFILIILKIKNKKYQNILLNRNFIFIIILVYYLSNIMFFLLVFDINILFYKKFNLNLRYIIFKNQWKKDKKIIIKSKIT